MMRRMGVETPITTRDAAIRAYRENKLYFARGGSYTQCEEFMDACLFLLETPVTRSEENGEALDIQVSIVQTNYEVARRWYDLNYARLASNRPKQTYAEFCW